MSGPFFMHGRVREVPRRTRLEVNVLQVTGFFDRREVKRYRFALPRESECGRGQRLDIVQQVMPGEE